MELQRWVGSSWCLWCPGTEKNKGTLVILWAANACPHTLWEGERGCVITPCRSSLQKLGASPGSPHWLGPLLGKEQ